MIDTRKELREWLKEDKKNFYSYSKKVRIIDKLTNSNLYIITKYLTYLRKEELYFNKRTNKICALLYLIYRRKKSKLGRNLGFTIEPNCLGKGVKIEHYGSIVVNGEAKIGDNCCFRGNNCVGKGRDGKSPIIGKNVDFGFGAVVIGGIEIADDVKIGAGAIVVRSCCKQGATLVGIPAREV